MRFAPPVVLLCASLVAGVLTSPEYDYIIVGGGPAGLVVANRLSENPNIIRANFLKQVAFSRGNTHISSDSPMAKSMVSPHHGMLEWDKIIHVAMAKLARSVPQRQQPFASTETSPGLSAIPADASDELWQDWLSQQYISSPHIVGTAAMKPRSQDGVVDAGMKVYGTVNVGVVDASTHPVLLGGHPMRIIYASAECISDIIKAEHTVPMHSRYTYAGFYESIDTMNLPMDQYSTSIFTKISDMYKIQQREKVEAKWNRDCLIAQNPVLKDLEKLPCPTL